MFSSIFGEQNRFPDEINNHIMRY